MMNLKPGSVDQTLAVLELYEKDPGFKSALESLKTADSKAKTSEREVAEFEARMKTASTEANRKEMNANQALEKLASQKGEIVQRESELELARVSFNEDMLARQLELTNKNKLLASEGERLKALDGQLKQLQGDLLRKSEVLEQEKQDFEAWRTKVKEALAA